MVGIVVTALSLAGCSPTPAVSEDPPLVRLDDSQTRALGWDPQKLDAVVTAVRALSTDTLIIATDNTIVLSYGETDRRYNIHSGRKAILSTLVAQHLGDGSDQIRLDATMAELDIDDSPDPLSELQKTATVHNLLKSMSGINHKAAAEGGLFAEKNRRLGYTDNQPGTIWAYNNWDYNTLTTIFEDRTGLSIGEAFKTGIAAPTGMVDFRERDVSYSRDRSKSQHKAAMFRLSGRDLLTFGELILNDGMVDGKRLIPEGWIDLITADYADTGKGGLSSGHGYLWWIPDASTGLPEGSFWASGLGNQSLFILPKWRTVIVHQADTTEFLRQWRKLQQEESLESSAAFEKLALSCLRPPEKNSEFCTQHGFVLRRPFTNLIRGIAAAHIPPSQ